MQPAGQLSCASPALSKATRIRATFCKPCGREESCKHEISLLALLKRAEAFTNMHILNGKLIASPFPWAG